MEKQTLKAAGAAQVLIHHYGAHLTSWTNSAGREMIYTSPTAIYNGEKAIRGGIPICFPQFAKHGPLRQHGFARNLPWAPDPSFNPTAQGLAARFVLTDTESTRASEWPHRFRAMYTVALSPDGDSLSITMDVTNNNPNTAFSFTTALHSYFTCDAETVALPDFNGRSYADSIDSEQPGKVKVQSSSITFGKEVDRVYKSTADTLTIPQAGLTLIKRNLPEAVVWNPYVDKAVALSDMPDDGWRNFICIEPARIDEPATVEPGQTWSCGLSLTSKA